jgi:glycosyltransferase involved in cell wall biosynthesis
VKSVAKIPDRPLHIGLVCHEYPPRPHGGIGSYAQDLAEGLASAGEKITVLGIGGSPTETRAQVTIRHLAPTGIRRPWRFHVYYERWRFTRWLKALHQEHPFDLIEVPDYDGWLPFGLGLRIPVIARLHGSNWLYDVELNRPGDPTTHNAERKSLLQATHWAGVSRFAFQRSLDLCGLSNKPGNVIYNAVDTSLFSPSLEDITEPGLIVFVNSLNRRKGLDTLLHAMKQVLPAEPKARLAIIGGLPSKMSEWEDMLNGLTAGQRDRIQFVGRQDRRTQVLDWLRRAEICCYPSRTETFGLAPVEAMATGKPTIYSRLGPGPEVIEENVSGLLCDPENPADLADKLLRLLRNPALGRQLGQVARQRVLAHFERDQWLRNNLAFYRECTATNA